MKKWDDISADDKVRARQIYEEGADTGEVAKMLGVHHAAVSAVMRREKWIKRMKGTLEDVRRDFEAGVLNYSEVAEKYGITTVYLQGQAKQHKWVRRLEKRIRAVAALKLHEEVAKALDEQRNSVMEEAVVEANAQLQAVITKHHRSGATKARETVLKLLEEMGALAIPYQDLQRFAQVAAMARSQEEEDFDTQSEVYREAMETFTKLIGLNGRSSTTKNLVEALTKVVDLERRVHGIREEVAENDALAALKALAGNG